MPVLLGYGAFCAGQIVSTTIRPRFSCRRVCIAIVFDQIFIASLINLAGVFGAPLAFTPAVATIGHGQRYGGKFAYLSCAVSFVCLSAAIYWSPYWRDIPLPAAGVVLTACCLPVYAAMLSARLAKDKQRMEAHAVEMEKAATTAQRLVREHQSELAHVNRLSTMGEMASGIAHEINQPLAAILSYNQACIRMLLDGEFKNDELIRAMKLTADQAKRAGDIIARLRSHIQKRTTALAPVDINQVVKDSLTLIEQGLREHLIVVQLDVCHTLPTIFADAIQLER